MAPADRMDQSRWLGPAEGLRCVQLTPWCLKGIGASAGTESKGLDNRASRCRAGSLQTASQADDPKHNGEACPTSLGS